MLNSRKASSFLYGMIAGCSLLFSQVSYAQDASFTDMETHWSKSQVQAWVSKGLVKGYSDGQFKPNHAITRAEFFTMVNKSFGFTKEKNIRYSDVLPQQWYAAEIAKAAEAGYVSGYEDGSIRPTAPITRQEVAVILTKLLNLQGEDQAVIQGYSDKFPDWSKAAIASVVSKGYMKGYPDQTFQPRKTITRAEAVVSLDKAAQNGHALYGQPGTYGPASGIQAVEGDVTISSKDVILQNTVVRGNLHITKDVREGTVELKNVMVLGTALVQGGGPNSVVLQDSKLSKLVINKSNGTARVLASGKTDISEVAMESGAKLEEQLTTGNGFAKVTVSEATPPASSVILAGNFESAIIKASTIKLQLSKAVIASMQVMDKSKDLNLTIPEDSVIQLLTLDSAIKAMGKGNIEKAVLNVAGTSFEKEPKQIENKAAAAPAGGGGGGLPSTPAQKIPTATNFSMSGGNFTGSDNEYSVDILNTSKIRNITADYNVDTDVEVLEILDQSGTDILGSSKNAHIQAGEQRDIDLINMLGLDIYDDGNDGITASHFAKIVNPGSENLTGTMTIKIRLTNGKKSNTYTLRVNIKESL